jgi:hypothetical protein
MPPRRHPGMQGVIWYTKKMRLRPLWKCLLGEYYYSLTSHTVIIDNPDAAGFV